jgi:hypothetical protein
MNNWKKELNEYIQILCDWIFHDLTYSVDTKFTKLRPSDFPLLKYLKKEILQSFG